MDLYEIELFFYGFLAIKSAAAHVCGISTTSIPNVFSSCFLPISYRSGIALGPPHDNETVAILSPFLSARGFRIEVLLIIKRVWRR